MVTTTCFLNVRKLSIYMKQTFKTRGTATRKKCTENPCPPVREAGEAQMRENISHKIHYSEYFKS